MTSVTIKPNTVRAWLAAGLLSAVVIPAAVEIAVPLFSASLPAEYARLDNRMTNMIELTAEETAAMVEMKRQTDNANVRLLLIAAGIPLVTIFGVFAGRIAERWPTGVLGAVAGVAITVVFASVASQPILELQDRAFRNRFNGDTTAMAMHCLQWTVLSVAAFAAILVGSGRVAISFRALGAFLIASVFAGIVYVVGGSLLDPANHTNRAEPVKGSARLLWTSFAPLLAALILARESSRTKT